MYEAYYKELDPAKREKILKELEETVTDKQDWELRKQLFDLRYTKNKQGEYVDRFLRGWLELKVAAMNLDRLFSEKKNKKTAMEVRKQLCLEQTELYTRETLYREMCNLVARYATACLKDTNYNSFIWGIGKISDEKVKAKIEGDLKMIGKTLPERLGFETEFQILQDAITNVEKELFTS